MLGFRPLASGPLGSSPTIDLRFEPAAAQLALTAVAPTIVVDVRRDPAAAQLALSTQAPTVATSDNKEFAPTTANLVLAGFAPALSLTGERSSEPITRVSQLGGIGAARYQEFQAKAQAQPEEDLIGFPAISPPVVEGDGFAILPELRALGRGVHGVVGEATVLLRLVGDAVGEVGVAGRANVTLAAFHGAAAGVHGSAGEARLFLNLPSVSSVGSVVAGGEARVTLPVLKGAAVGHHDPDDEDAILAWLLAA